MTPITALQRSQERCVACKLQRPVLMGSHRARRFSSLVVLGLSSCGGPTSAAGVAITGTAPFAPVHQRLHFSEIDDEGGHIIGAELFDNYREKFGRNYRKGSKEYEHRQALFAQRLASVERHNARPSQSWKAAAGPFADRTEAERAAARGWRRQASNPTSGGVPRSGHSGGPASLIALEAEPRMPRNVDWRFLTVAREVVDQSACGSCWAATAASVLEAHYELHHGTPRSFSIQEILSCTPNPRHCGGSGGCEGATVEEGMEWVLRNGINDEAAVPYEAKDTECTRGSLEEETANTERTDSSHEGGAGTKDIGRGGHTIGLIGWETIMPKNHDHPLAKAVVDYGPVAVSVAADLWHEYSSGIFDSCGQDVIVDHAVTLYGYGEEGGRRFWRIRNTWGPSWGEDGFIRVLRQNDGETYCGQDFDNQQGVGCKDDPKVVEVCGMCGVLSDSVVPHFAGGKNISVRNRKAMYADVDSRLGVETFPSAAGAGIVSSAESLAEAGGISPLSSIVRRERI